MARTTEEFAQEIKRWRHYLADINNNVPYDDTHTYKNPNDVYERLTYHLKTWVEGEFGVYMDPTGKLKDLSIDKRTQASVDLEETVGFKMTFLKENWYSAALKGNKKAMEAIPHYTDSALSIADETIDDVRAEMVSTFFPAYRALEESFSKRSIWQWFTNHAQYTAERDALKVMKNMLKTAMHTDEKGLAQMLKANQEEIGNEIIENSKPLEPTKMYDAEREEEQEKENESVYENEKEKDQELYQEIENSNDKENDLNIKNGEDSIEKVQESKENEEKQLSEEEQDMLDNKRAIRNMILDEYPELDHDPKHPELDAEKDERLNQMVEETYTRWVIHDEICDKYPEITDKEVLDRMTDEEIARRAAEANKPEKIDLSKEFSANNEPKSEMIELQDSPVIEKKVDF